MAFQLGGSDTRLRPSMNVTPLVDVVLVLLIIFMVVTPLLTKQVGLTVPAKPPEDQPAPPPDPLALPPVVLSVGADGEPRINGEPVARADMAPRLERMLNARADKVVFFDASDAVPYGRAMDVLDAARGGGIGLIAVLPDALEATPASP